MVYVTLSISPCAHSTHQTQQLLKAHARKLEQQLRQLTAATTGAQAAAGGGGGGAAAAVPSSVASPASSLPGSPLRPLPAPSTISEQQKQQWEEAVARLQGEVEGARKDFAEAHKELREAEEAHRRALLGKETEVCCIVLCCAV